MPTHEAAVRNQMADDILTQVGNAAYLRFETSGDAEISTHTFPTPSGAVSGPTLTFTCGTAGIADTGPNAGTIVQASLYKSGATKVLEATAAATGTPEIDVSSATIATTDTVTLTALSWVAPI